MKKQKQDKSSVKKNKKNNTNKVGRPTKLSDEVVRKLESAFSIGCNVSQACLHAGISRDTFYKFIDKNKEFSDRFNIKNKIR